MITDSLSRASRFITQLNGVYSAGAWAGGGEKLVLHNPSTGGELARLAGASASDVDAVLDRAVSAFEESWTRWDPRDRYAQLDALADLVALQTEELALLETLNTGKPLNRARGEVGFAVATLRYFAATPLRIHGEVNPSMASTLCYTDRLPHGVCGAIVPNNYPLLLAVWKVAGALAHGNSVVVKPAEETPVTMLRLAELADEAGLPPGSLGVLTGGPAVGEQLCRDPRVGLISFTGSVEGGRAVGAMCGSQVKPVSLELGGKSPMVVFEDADLDATAAAIVAASMGNTGQMCVAGSRVLAAEAIAGPLLERIVAGVRRLRVGTGMDEGTDLGPMVSAEGRDRVFHHVERAASMGRELVGDGPTPSGGFFVRPAVFGPVQPSAPLAQDEVFGPVLAVMTFGTEDEALRLANDTRYGLAASVWTSDLSRALKFTRSVRAGMVWVNSHGDTDEAVSVGGVKASGYGRELGLHSREQYTVTRSVWLSRG